MDNDVSMGGSRGGASRGGGNTRGGRGRGRPVRQKGEHRAGLKEGSMLVSRVNQRAGNRAVSFRGRTAAGRGKTDQDGDVGMDNGQTDTRKWRANKDAFTGSAAESWVSVRGYDETATPTELGQFLISKADGVPIAITDTKVEGQKILYKVETSHQAMTLQKLSGIRYKGSMKLIINFASGRGTIIRADRAPKIKFTQKLGPELEQRYNKENKFLNLAGMSADPTSPYNFNDADTMRALFGAIAAKCQGVETIHFGNNRIKSLTAFAQLTKYVPSIVNLSFDTNLISDFAELNTMKNIPLRELYLVNNPIKLQNSDEKYQSEITRRFGTLKYLDGQKLPELSLPPILGNLFDSPDTQRLAEAFLQRFFSVYDEPTKDKLVDVYGDNAFFSVSTSLPSTLRDKVTRTKEESLHEYKFLSRNLLHVGADRKSSLSHSGRINIVAFLNTLPQTKHKYDELRIDAFVLQEVLPGAQFLSINVHGHFTEVKSNVLRTYDRTFLLLPCPPNSPAASQGWPAVIINDQLHIRQFTPLVPPSSTAPVNLPSGVDQILEKLVFTTKLKPDFAKQCLEQNAWSYDKAVEAFMTLQARNVITADMLLP